MIHALDTFLSFFMMVVDSEDLRALVAYLSVVLFVTTRPSEGENFWVLGTKVPADSKPGVAVSPLMIHSTLHRYGKALSKPWLCSYSLGKAVPPCSTRRSLKLSRQDSFGTPVGVRLSFLYPSPMRGPACHILARARTSGQDGMLGGRT